MARTSQKYLIMESALACFAERGYDATRVRHIAERAGVSDAALYRHFPSMEAIGQELFATTFGRYATILAAIADGPGTPLDKLGRTVRAILAAYRADPNAFVFTLLWKPSFLPQLTAHRYPLEIVESVVAAGQAAGQVRGGQPNLLTSVLLGCVLYPITTATLATPGALDLLHDTRHDAAIESAALAALRKDTP